MSILHPDSPFCDREALEHLLRDGKSTFSFAAEESPTESESVLDSLPSNEETLPQWETDVQSEFEGSEETTGESANDPRSVGFLGLMPSEANAESESALDSLPSNEETLPQWETDARADFEGSEEETIMSENDPRSVGFLGLLPDEANTTLSAEESAPFLN
jgi:hypothetical protein